MLDRDMRREKEDIDAMRAASRYYRPHLPEKATPANVAIDLLKPNSPIKGPPVPEGWDLSWPGFITRALHRLMTEGINAPWKTIKEKGLSAEIKRELELLTGKHYE